MDRVYLKRGFSRTFRPVEYGSYKSCPIDQQAVRSFNIDPVTGRPVSDMSAILNSKGLEQQRLLADLQEFKADYLPADVSDEDALKFMLPRLSQLPSELADFQEQVTKARLEEEKVKQREKELEEYRKSLESDEKKKDVEEPKKS